MPVTTPPATASFPVRQFHALEGDGVEPGTFEAIVSTFNTRVERIFYDQMLKPGCFARTLKERGLPACVWSHGWDVPPIGRTLEAKEIDEGLYVKGQLFVGDQDDHEVARQVWTAMRAQGGDEQYVLREFSIGFDVVDAAMTIVDEDEVLEITDVELYEYGPCLVGANVSRLLTVNSAGREATDPDSDPIWQRFGRPEQHKKDTPSDLLARRRELDLARPRHITPKEA